MASPCERGHASNLPGGSKNPLLRLVCLAGLVQEWSPSAVAATGLDGGRVVGRKACDMLGPSQAVSAAIADALAGRVTTGLEVWLDHSSGADAAKCGGCVRLLLQVAPGSDGGVVFAGQDVSSIGGGKGAGPRYARGDECVT